MHANLEMEAYVCSLQFTLNYDLHMPQELQLQMMTLGHAAARQPENRIAAEMSVCVIFVLSIEYVTSLI